MKCAWCHSLDHVQADCRDLKAHDARMAAKNAAAAALTLDEVKNYMNQAIANFGTQGDTELATTQDALRRTHQ